MLKKFYKWLMNLKMFKKNKKKNCKNCRYLHYLPNRYYCGHYKECGRDISNLQDIDCDSFIERGEKFWFYGGGKF